MAGHVKTPIDLQVGSIHRTNSNGDIKILDYQGHNNITVLFLDTLAKRITDTGNIRKGVVKDYHRPNVYGVGFVGTAEIGFTLHKGKSSKIYDTWHSMLRRCYCPKALLQDPGYVGVVVVPEWHNFKVFQLWYLKECTALGIDAFSNDMQLDKDIALTRKLKEYSPKTCALVTCQVNGEEATAKYWELTSPEGVKVKIYNLGKFARDNDLIASSLYGLVAHQSTGRQHRGWTI